MIQQMSSEGSVPESCKELSVTQYMYMNLDGRFIRISIPVLSEIVNESQFMQVYF
jgi:hypothetical protein